VETAVQEALDAIRPALQADGGDIRILSLDE
jgi:Fe-S cluster biogenesis protein NfuA